MKFPYARFGSYYMPVIPVTLVYGDHCLVTEALVDSGAASNIFDAQFAHALGIPDLESGSTMQFEGVSGHVLVGYQHTFTLEIGGNRITDIPIAFSAEMPDNAVNILGQRGFFDHWPVKFTYAKKEIELMASPRL
ncbi:MAG: retropepsin-like aspartic protease [Candidatus Peribacteraceae bacterium]|nr:retropepsin-like aspartic protease [Candidatus Peribacteraceae bacterium]